MERPLLALIFIFLEIIGSLSQDRLYRTTSTPSSAPPSPLPPPPPPPLSRPRSSPLRPPPPRWPEDPPGTASSTTGERSTHSKPLPPRRHPDNGNRHPYDGNRRPYDGNRHIKKTPVRKINLGKKIGLLFAGIAAILQVAVVAYLVLKKRQISKMKDRHET